MASHRCDSKARRLHERLRETADHFSDAAAELSEPPTRPDLRDIVAAEWGDMPAEAEQAEVSQ